MKHEILYQGAFSALKVHLDPGEGIKAESGAMVTKDSHIDVDSKLEGGVLGGIGRMLSGEKFFFQTLTAQTKPGDTILAPAVLGDIIELDLDGSVGWNVAKDGYFASEMNINVNTKMQNLGKGLFSGEGFFILKLSGSGKLFLSSFGATHKVEIPVGEEYIVDNGHLVAWPDNVNYKVEKAAKGWIKSFTSGEGLVCRFTGPGTIYVQTRNARGFGGWMRPYIPVKR